MEGDLTYVRAVNLLTAAIDADNHDFAASPQASNRVDIHVQVTIDQWDKNVRTPAGRAAGQPSTRTINNTLTPCEIGAVKPGKNPADPERISITHFQKV